MGGSNEGLLSGHHRRRNVSIADEPRSSRRRRIRDIPALCTDAITEILIRLPIDLLARSKSVSKEWRRIISDLSFVSAYESRNPSSLAGFFTDELPLDLKGRKHTTADFIPCSSLLVNPLPAGQCCCASSNGLLLILADNVHYSILNPITGSSSRIPPKRFEEQSRGYGIVSSSSSSDSAIVIFLTRILLDPTDRYRPRTNKLRVDTFSSDTGEWRESYAELARPIKFEPETSVGMVASDGIMYWLDCTRCEVGGSVVAYDPIEGSIELIEMPPWSVDEAYFSWCSLRLDWDGSLLLCKKKGWNFLMWGMVSQGKREWCLRHRFEFGFLNDWRVEIVYVCEGAVYLSLESKIVRCCHVEGGGWRVEEVCSYPGPCGLNVDLFPFLLSPCLLK